MFMCVLMVELRHNIFPSACGYLWPRPVCLSGMPDVIRLAQTH